MTRARLRGVVPLVVIAVIAGGVAAGGLIYALVAGGKTTLAEQCASQAIQAGLPKVEGEAWAILNSSNPDWQGLLNALVTAEGVAVKCAVAALLQQNGLPSEAAKLAYSRPGAELPKPNVDLVKTRAAEWLAANGGK